MSIQSLIPSGAVSLEQQQTVSAVTSISFTGLSGARYLLIAYGTVNGVNDWEMQLNASVAASYNSTTLRQDGATLAGSNSAAATSFPITNNIVTGRFQLGIVFAVEAASSRIIIQSHFSQDTNNIFNSGSLNVAATSVTQIDISTGGAQTFSGEFRLYRID